MERRGVITGSDRVTLNWTYPIGQEVGVLEEMLWHLHRQTVMHGERFFDEPRCMQVSLSLERILKERSEIEFGVDLAIASDVLLVDQSLASVFIVNSDEIPRKGVALYRSIRSLDHRKHGLLTNCAGYDVALLQSYQDVLARKEFALEFVVDPVD